MPHRQPPDSELTDHVGLDAPDSDPISAQGTAGAQDGPSPDTVTGRRTYTRAAAVLPVFLTRTLHRRRLNRERKADGLRGGTRYK